MAFKGLKQEIEKTGEHTYRLIVYPKVTHFPKRDQTHQVAFQLVGFDLGRDPNGISHELEDNQFKLSGLWQFIPVCRPPCISIFRNFDPKLLKYFHQMDNPAKKVRTLKASHIPLLWKDSPVRPFRRQSSSSQILSRTSTFRIQVQNQQFQVKEVKNFTESQKTLLIS